MFRLVVSKVKQTVAAYIASVIMASDYIGSKIKKKIEEKKKNGREGKEREKRGREGNKRGREGRKMVKQQICTQRFTKVIHLTSLSLYMSDKYFFL